MSFIDEENYRMKRARKKHKGIVISSIAGTIVGAFVICIWSSFVFK